MNISELENKLEAQLNVLDVALAGDLLKAYNFIEDVKELSDESKQRDDEFKSLDYYVSTMVNGTEMTHLEANATIRKYIRDHEGLFEQIRQQSGMETLFNIDPTDTNPNWEIFVDPITNQSLPGILNIHTVATAYPAGNDTFSFQWTWTILLEEYGGPWANYTIEFNSTKMENIAWEYEEEAYAAINSEIDGLRTEITNRTDTTENITMELSSLTEELKGARSNLDLSISLLGFAVSLLTTAEVMRYKIKQKKKKDKKKSPTDQEGEGISDQRKEPEKRSPNLKPYRIAALLLVIVALGLVSFSIYQLFVYNMAFDLSSLISPV